VALMREQEGGEATGREALGMEALGKRKREDGGSEVPEKWARREDSMGARNAGVEVAEARGSVEEPRRRRRCKTSWDGAQARSESIPTEVGAGHPEDPLSMQELTHAKRSTCRRLIHSPIRVPADGPCSHRLLNHLQRHPRTSVHFSRLVGAPSR
jgi:hypothetical protein